MQKKRPVYQIDWTDITTQDRWHNPKENTLPLHCRTVGILISKPTAKDKNWRLAGSFSFEDDGREGNIAGEWIIPHAVVKKVRRIGTTD